MQPKRDQQDVNNITKLMSSIVICGCVNDDKNTNSTELRNFNNGNRGPHTNDILTDTEEKEAPGSVASLNDTENVTTRTLSFSEPAAEKVACMSWWQPDTSEFNIRGKGYLTDRKKIPSAASPVMSLAGVDLVRVGTRFDNFCSHKDSWLQKNLKFLGNAFVLAINIQVASVGVSLVTYHVLPNGLGTSGDSTFDDMFEYFMDASSGTRDKRFKFIPRITDGPWICKKAVQSTPVIIGTKVTQRYFRGANYFEIDIHADSSTFASSIISFVQGYSTKLTVSFIWLLESRTVSELPERILAATTVEGMDFSKAPHVAPVN